MIVLQVVPFSVACVFLFGLVGYLFRDVLLLDRQGLRAEAPNFSIKHTVTERDDLTLPTSGPRSQLYGPQR